MRFYPAAIARLALAGAALAAAPLWAADSTPHGDLAVECSDCHTVEAWSPLREPLPFEHEEMGFSLAGAHAGVSCRSCHADLVFSTAVGDCIACHQQDLDRVREPDHSSFPRSCETCHAVTGWEPATFEHDQTGFILRGAHRAVGCVDCHADGYAGTAQDCLSCHESDFSGARDPDHSGFPTACESCHSETAWEPASFEHDQTGFILRGAHRTVGCADCHSEGYAGTPQDCFSCHESDFSGARDPDHSGFPTACESCHTETAWEPASFEHDQTGFILRGAHRTVGCADCHAEGYAGTPQDCFSCHESDFSGARDPDHSGFPTACESCHSETAWEPASFEHDQSGFILRGAHRAVACIDCHSEGYSGTPQDCFSCHETDYNGARDPDHSGFPTSCEGCHSETAWEPASFNHNQTGFPLDGAHASTDCAECHAGGYSGTPTQCFACHQSEYNGTNDPDHQAAAFPTTCEICHSTTTWGNANWNHNAFFPLERDHRDLDCQDCHVSSGSYAAFECILCHEHRQSEMDDEHDEVAGYVWASPACLACHPDGRD